MSDLLFEDATDLLQALGRRRISALELLERSLERNRALASEINAVVAEDLDRARERARTIDARRAAGEGLEDLGPLAGLPMTVKDGFDVEGMPASSGLKAFLGRPAEDAAAVRRTRAAGAVIWGKTNVPPLLGDWQTRNDLYGRTNNPYDPDRTPGGSSGGSAAALAAGITPLEIGSDIGGSLRVPAAFCGVFSHKPTHGLVPQRGHVPPRPGAAAERDINVVGPMARSARDLRLLFSILSDGFAAAHAPPAELKGLRVGLWLEEPGFILDQEIRTVLEGLGADLAAEGAEVEPVVSPVSGTELREVYLDLLYPLIAEDFPEERLRTLRLLSGPARLFGGSAPWARTARAATISHLDWLKRNEARARMGLRAREVFRRLDVLIAPVAPTAAFLHTGGRFAGRKLACSDGSSIPYESMLDWIAFASALLLPATTLPVGRTPGGLPVGAQIIGPKGADGRLLAVAEAVEARLGGFRPPALAWTPD